MTKTWTWRGRGRAWLGLAALIALSLAVSGCGLAGDADDADGWSTDDVQRISPSEAKSLTDRGEAVLYDARDTEWYEREHAAGAMSLPEQDVSAQIDALPGDRALIFYCT